jgi:hypothetical protein
MSLDKNFTKFAYRFKESFTSIGIQSQQKETSLIVVGGRNSKNLYKFVKI